MLEWTRSSKYQPQSEANHESNTHKQSHQHLVDQGFHAARAKGGGWPARTTCASTSRADPNGRTVCSSSSWRASASDDYGCRAASTTNGSCGLAIPRIAAGGNERSGAWLDAARSNAAGMRRSGAPSRAQTTIRECPHTGSERGVDSRRRGRTTQLSPSIGPRSTGLRRRLVRRRGVRLQVEQRSFSQNYQHGDGKGTTVARALTIVFTNI